MRKTAPKPINEKATALPDWWIASCKIHKDIFVVCPSIAAAVKIQHRRLKSHDATAKCGVLLLATSVSRAQRNTDNASLGPAQRTDNGVSQAVTPTASYPCLLKYTVLGMEDLQSQFRQVTKNDDFAPFCTPSK